MLGTCITLSYVVYMDHIIFFVHIIMCFVCTSHYQVLCMCITLSWAVNLHHIMICCAFIAISCVVYVHHITMCCAWAWFIICCADVLHYHACFVSITLSCVVHMHYNLAAAVCLFVLKSVWDKYQLDFNYNLSWSNATFSQANKFTNSSSLSVWYLEPSKQYRLVVFFILMSNRMDFSNHEDKFICLKWERVLFSASW